MMAGPPGTASVRNQSVMDCLLAAIDGELR